MKRGFGSDNHSGICPEALEAIVRVNQDHALAYGDDEYCVCCRQILLPSEPPGKPCCLPGAAAAAKSLQLCLTLCDPIDSSPPDSAIPGILQARTLEWVAISLSNA